MTFVSPAAQKFIPLMSVLTTICLCATSVHAISNPWEDIITNSVQANTLKRATVHDKNVLATEERLIQSSLSKLSHVLTHESVNTPMVIPLPNNTMATYAFTYDPIMAPELAKKYPNILTFKAVDTNNPLNTGRFSLTPKGFHGIFTHDGKRVLIDPKLRKGSDKHTTYYEQNALPISQRKPDLVRVIPSNMTDVQRFAKSSLLPAKRTVVAGNQLTTYRLAISASGEYTQFHGGTVTEALAAITTTINRVNEVYERDASVRFQLVANNDKVIYTNAQNDPFKNDDNHDLEANEAVIQKNIGLNNVDLAHVFNTGGGGLATLSSVCTSVKTQGVTGNTSPTGDSFDYSYVAHELGHQLGANHSFNGTAASCGNGNRHAGSAWEPGSGSTIMSYAGICESDNIQADGDAVFHIGSIQEIRKVVSEATCGTKTPVSNQAPIANAGPDYVIPAYTPFKLTGTGTDADADDTLSYIWEQLNSGKASGLNANGSSKDVGSGALFRSYEPINTPVRYFPKLKDVMSNRLSRGEGYPTTNRDLFFHLTVRDNHGGVATDRTVITVKNTGRAFSILQPSESTRWPVGGQGRVVWDRAGTTEADVNCQNVDILYDSGEKTFSTVLAKSVPNNGEHVVKVPTKAATNANVMVRCSTSVFYAVSPKRFSIVNASNATPFDTTSVPDGASGPPAQTSSSTGSSSGSGGGGSTPPIMVLLLMCAALVSGCKTLSEKNNQTPELDTSHPLENINWEISPEVAARQAIANNDYKLFVTTGRLPVPLGIPVSSREKYKKLCGTRPLPNTGDTLKTQADLQTRKKRTAYAERYNLAIYSYCTTNKN